MRARERARKGQGGVVDRSPEGVIFSSRVGGSASGRQTSSQEKLSTNYLEEASQARSEKKSYETRCLFLSGC